MRADIEPSPRRRAIRERHIQQLVALLRPVRVAVDKRFIEIEHKGFVI